ncbi:alkaline phosphatase family protein [Pseudomonas paralactis]|uniref:alkaline phosphatase family protein n=1 Tax=Pseudomonas paralactis TaxID=1615673 RepID=UPI0016466267|nr:alkaline phosphatase family protein [Pseudomonas paralactis]MBC3258474.1 alkaline phosphatase family protein [Pseudomonas paralactis]
MSQVLQKELHAQKSGLAQLSHAILASLGVLTFEPGFNLQPANKIIVFMVDGLGLRLLDEYCSNAPFLKTLLGRSQSFRVGFPATTATSLASFALGQGSGEHGVVGSRFALDAQTSFTPLPWKSGSPHHDQDLIVELSIFKDETTAWETAREQGLNIECILPAKFVDSRYSKAVYRGATFTPYEDYSHCGFRIRNAQKNLSRQLIYVYLGELDYAGHIHGPHSQAWLNRLQEVDTLISSIASTLTQGTQLLVTADHGMTTLCSEVSFDFDTDQHLQEGVAWIAGDIRARHIYVKDGNFPAVMERWKNKLGDDFTVLSRSQAVNEGLFGGSTRFEQRIGDMIVYPTGQGGILQSLREKDQTLWNGHHGALTDEDQLSPLLIYTNR